MHYPGMHILSPNYKTLVELAQQGEGLMTTLNTTKPTTTTAKATVSPMPNKRIPSQKYYIIMKDHTDRTSFFSSTAYVSLTEAERNFENIVNEYKATPNGTIKPPTVVLREDGDKNRVYILSLTGLKPFHLYIYKDDGSDTTLGFPTKPADFNDELSKYQEWTKTTGGKHFNVETSLTHWVIGAVGESTEVLEAIRKNQSVDLLTKELGDVLYYLCMSANSIASRMSYVEVFAQQCTLSPVDGVVVETGKALEMIKKYLAYDKQLALDRQPFFDCISRAYIYLFKLCAEKNISLSTVMEENKKKLIAKYPDRNGQEVQQNFMVVKLNSNGVY